MTRSGLLVPIAERADCLLSSELSGVSGGAAHRSRRVHFKNDLRVEISDQLVTDRVINELMGKDASARFRFIMDRADNVVELDV